MIGNGLILAGLGLGFFRFKPLLNFFRKPAASPDERTVAEEPEFSIPVDKKLQSSTLAPETKEMPKTDNIPFKKSADDSKPQFSSPETRAFIDEMKKNRDIQRDYGESDHSKYMPQPPRDHSSDS